MSLSETFAEVVDRLRQTDLTALERDIFNNLERHAEGLEMSMRRLDEMVRRRIEKANP